MQRTLLSIEPGAFHTHLRQPFLTTNASEASAGITDCGRASAVVQKFDNLITRSRPCQGVNPLTCSVSFGRFKVQYDSRSQ